MAGMMEKLFYFLFQQAMHQAKKVFLSELPYTATISEEIPNSQEVTLATGIAKQAIYTLLWQTFAVRSSSQ